ARYQVVVGIAEARGAVALAVARVGAANARREMGDDDGAFPVARRARELGLEPGAAGEALLADRLGVEPPRAAGRLHQLGEVAAGAHRLGPAAVAEQVEVAPADRAEDADPAAAVVADDEALALEHRDPERRAAGAQRRPRF